MDTYDLDVCPWSVVLPYALEAVSWPKVLIYVLGVCFFVTVPGVYGLGGGS